MAISACLVDTNILLRAARRSDPQYPLVHSALTRLALQQSKLYYTHQNIAEMWNAMTRPVLNNGLGLSVSDAEREVLLIENAMLLLPDNESVYREWRRIVVQHAVSGVRVHDARLAATLCAHGVKHLLTLNVADFSRFTGVIPVHPSDV